MSAFSATPSGLPGHGGDGAKLKKALAVSVVLHVVIFVGMSLQFRFKADTRFYAPIQMVELSGGKHSPKPSVAKAPAPQAPKPVPAAAPKPAPPPPPPPAKTVSKPAPPPLKAPVAVSPPPNAVTVPVEAPVKKKPPEPEYTATDTAQKLARMREKFAAESAPAPAEKPADVRGAIESIRKRVDETAHKPAAKAAPALGGDGPAGVMGGPETGGALAAMRSTAYRNLLWSHVKQNWALPPSLQGARFQTVVGVLIDRDGVVRKSWVENGSGSEAFDQSALRAIGRSSPLPPVPRDVPDDDFKDGIFFRFRE